jgi:hypothetical protein
MQIRSKWRYLLQNIKSDLENNIFIRGRNNSFKLCASIAKSVSHLKICITAFFMETIKQQMRFDYFFTAKQGLN